MSSPNHTFLSLIPTAHQVANISLFTSPVDAAVGDESVIPALPKVRRSSSTATTESTSTDDRTLSVDTVDPIAESPAEQVNVSASSVSVERPVPVHRFLKLGN